MTLDIKIFYQTLVVALLGFLFYYGTFLFGIMDASMLQKVIAIVLLLVALPLPIMALHNKVMFKGMHKGTHQVLSLMSVGILFHHAVLTFVIVMFSNSGVNF